MGTAESGRWRVWAAILAGAVALGISGSHAGLAATPAGQGAGAMHTSRKVLQGVPRIGFDTHVCPFPGSLYACLQYMGEKPDYDLISATSGAAWRRFYNRDDGGNVDLMYLGDAVWNHVFPAVGFEYQHIKPTDRDALIKATKASIDADRPVISYGIIGPPEAGVIAGYDKDGQVLIGWNYFFDPKVKYYEKADWKPCIKEGRGFVMIGQKKPKPSDRETLIATLRFAIDLARVAKRPDQPNHVAGLAAYDAWADGLLVDADFPADNKQEMGVRQMILGDQLAMLIERRYGGKYLRKMAAIVPEARTELETAATLLSEVAQSESGISRGGASFDPRNLAQRQWRMELADAIRQAGQKEQEAIACMEQALEVLAPSAKEDTQP